VLNPSSYKVIVVPKRNSTKHSSNPLFSAKSFFLRTTTLGKSYAAVKASLKPEETKATAATNQTTKPSQPATTSSTDGGYGYTYDHTTAGNRSKVRMT